MNRTDSSRGKRYFLKTQPILMHMGQSPWRVWAEPGASTSPTDCPRWTDLPHFGYRLALDLPGRQR